MLQGCITAMVTPMLADGKIDFAAIDKFVEWQIESGIDGLVVGGSTGEGTTLTEVEKLELVKYIIKLNQSRIKIIVGIGSASTEAILELIKKINQISGIDYLMCSTPYYVKPTQEGLYQHFALIAKYSAFPVIIYNHPGRTGCDMQDPTIIRLAHDFENIAALKDASGDIRRCLYVTANKPENFSLFSGNDADGLAFILAGGNGVISVASNIRPKLFADMCKLALALDRVKSTQINNKLLPLYDMLGCESNPIPVKWGLFFEGKLSSAHLRLPLTELNIIYRQGLEECLTRISG